MNSRHLSFLLSICFLNAFGSVELIKQNPSELGLKLKTEAPRLSKVTLKGTRYSKITSPELRNEEAPGSPEIPTESALIWIPAGMKATLRVHPVSGRKIKLNHDLSYLESIPNHCGSPSAPVPKNSLAYQKNYGTPRVEITETGFGASDKFARIKFWPYQYHPSKKQVIWAPELLVTVSLSQTLEKEMPVVTSSAHSLASYLALNPPRPRPPSQNLAPLDLIISHPSYESTLARYIDFKRLSGRETKTLFVDQKSNQEIKEMILREYSLSNPPASVLLVGNIEQIPSWKGSSDNRWTDFYYTTLDNDSLPDISLGRVPVHSSDELTSFIDKAISREKDPRKVEEFLLTAGQDESLGCPKNVTKVGAKISAGAPTAHITKKYRTEVGTEEVISAYNTNPNIIVYDGHGNRQGMTEIPLLISSLEKLSNSTYPLILDIACLNANWGSKASPRNFAESILLSSNRGAAGIMASGGSGYGHDFFQTIGDLIGKAHPEKGLDPKMNEIGQVILAAKIKHGSQDRTYWNYYGDPSSSIWNSPASH